MNGTNDSQAYGPLVIKLGGLAVEDPLRAQPLLRAIASLHERAPEGVVIVHGGGKAVDRRLERLGMAPVRSEGLRVTPPDQIDVVVAVLGGIVNKRLVAALSSLNCSAVGLCIGDGGITVARKLMAPGVDLGLVGEIVGGDPTLLKRLVADGYLPVISPIATSSDGELLNVNGDDAAAAIASIVSARLLVLLTDVEGVLDGSGRIVSSLDAQSIEQMITSKTIHGGMIPKVRAALHAATAAGSPVLIASWNQPERLAQIASGSLPGTLVLPAAQATHTSQGAHS